MLIELFSLGVTAEALRANIGSKSAISLQRGLVDPKFQVEGVAPTNHSFSQKILLNDLSYGIKIWTDLSSVFLQCTRLTDGRTDRRTEFSSLDRVCIACVAVKMAKFYGNILSLSENIAKSFRGGVSTFLTHTLYKQVTEYDDD